MYIKLPPWGEFVGWNVWITHNPNQKPCEFHLPSFISRESCLLPKLLSSKHEKFKWLVWLLEFQLCTLILYKFLNKKKTLVSYNNYTKTPTVTAPVWQSIILSILDKERTVGQTWISACCRFTNPFSIKTKRVEWAVFLTWLSLVPKFRTTIGKRQSLRILFNSGIRTAHSMADVAIFGICSSRSVLTILSAINK